MNKHSMLSLVALGCIIAPGCASMGPIETSGEAALPPFSTFRLHEEQFVFANEVSAEQRSEVASRLREAVVSALNERGYRQAADADVLVVLGAISRPVLSSEAGTEGGAVHPVDTSVFDAGRVAVPESVTLPPPVGREGDLILDLLDPKTRRVVWHASATGAATTPAEAVRMARATYTAMINKLPKARP